MVGDRLLYTVLKPPWSTQPGHPSFSILYSLLPVVTATTIEELNGRPRPVTITVGILKASRLRLNPTKTQVMWLGSPQQLAKVNVSDVPVASARINVSETAGKLGVIVDSQLTLSAQVATMCRSGYYQLQ